MHAKSHKQTKNNQHLQETNANIVLGTSTEYTHMVDISNRFLSNIPTKWRYRIPVATDKPTTDWFVRLDDLIEGTVQTMDGYGIMEVAR